MMYLVKKGGDRQEIHEVIRELSVETAKDVKTYGKDNNLIDKIVKDSRLNITREEVDKILNEGNFTGLASSQTVRFCEQVLKPIIKDFDGKINTEVKV